MSEALSAALELQMSAHRPFFFCMQTLQASEADPEEVWAWSTDGLRLILQYSRLDAAESGPEPCKNYLRDNV